MKKTKQTNIPSLTSTFSERGNLGGTPSELKVPRSPTLQLALDFQKSLPSRGKPEDAQESGPPGGAKGPSPSGPLPSDQPKAPIPAPREERRLPEAAGDSQ